MLEKRPHGRKRIHDFLKELGKEVPPLPAGGCAAALAGAMCAALEQFVIRLTIRKRKNPDSTVTLTEILPRLKDLQKKCVEMMDGDVQAYEQLMRALRMPTTTQVEKTRKGAALREAKVEVLGPPLALAEGGLEMLRYSRLLIEKTYPMAVADAGVATEMAHACLCSALWITRANLLGISDTKLVSQQVKILQRLQMEGDDLYRKIQYEIEKRLSLPSGP
jgi:formiminotetrahydrofolate cyclodeaminase